MSAPDISSHTPLLTEAAFCLLLQSFLHHQKGKYDAAHHSWMPTPTFAAHTWASYGCTAAKATQAAANLCRMLNLPCPPAPAPEQHLGDFAAACHRQWRDSAHRVTFFTSGSTGVPAPCTHSEAELRQEAEGVLRINPALFTSRREVLVTVPLHHLFGFTFGLCVPLVLGLGIRVEAPLPTAVARQIHHGDMVVGIPLLWAHLATLESLRPCDALFLSATAPLEDAVLGALREKGFACVEIFGSSETGALGWRGEAAASFTLLPHFTADADNATVAVQRQLPHGGTRAIPLQDHFSWQGTRQFSPGGRKDKAVQVGGVNVYPARIADILRQHPHVRECAVRPMKPENGARLKAFIVPSGDVPPQQIRKSLRAFAKLHLQEEEQPVRFTMGDALPRNNMGKLADWEE